MSDQDDRRDPFEVLAQPIEPQPPRPAFRRRLRHRLVAELGLEASTLPTIDLPERKPMTTIDRPTPTATAVTPYLTVTGGAAALDWYARALGAVESFRVAGDDGRLGHAEFTVGTARFMLSDEYPEMGVKSPTTLGGSAVALHLAVTDVDGAFARAVDAGATALQEPADQPHGARHGTLVDPYGHRWMLSQQVEAIDLDTYAQRSEGSGFTVEQTGAETTSAAESTGATASTGAAGPANAGAPYTGGIWSAVFYRDVRAGIRFLVDVFGFQERIVVPGPDGHSVVHSELVWPDGGVLQAGTYDPDNPFSLRPGEQSLYVVTADPHAVWARCQAAGLEVVRPPESPDYDPDGMGFSVRDPEGNVFSFGSYAG